ncbi:histone deacetylase 6 isoform X2 [Tachypleus tridentatus]|uniref:histone deacetylase 6 isoform X2 n=1 Tax=Tachypleus tridentatus TaxID=6853 RepID=UPI003FD452E9
MQRPPGHHAMEDKACGFCYFNNVAVAVKYALKHYALNRILIVDWDVHHGQATQYAFYDDPRVLYFSIHLYEHGAFWPELRESNFDYVGEGSGKGFNINVPLNKTGMGNEDYLAIFQNILLPVAYEYSPELVIVSAGYDAALGCPEGKMEISPAAYSHFLHSLMGLATGKVCVVLEGGYCVSSLAEGVALSLRTLLGDPCPDIGPVAQPSESVVETILNVIASIRPFWHSLQLQGSYDENKGEIKSTERIRHRPEIYYLGQAKIQETYPTRYLCINCDNELKTQLEQQIEQLIRQTDLTVPPHRTALVFDERMMKHHNHMERGHPERAERITSIYNKLKELGYIDMCYILKSRFATEEEIALVHKKDYIYKMKKTETMKPRDIHKFQTDYDSIYMCKETYGCALLATGTLLQLTEAVCSRTFLNGVAIIRPPGHHAEAGEASGFCFFNSVAIAAKFAMTKFDLKRIMIIDWDVHHGNGTQHAFEEDPRVLYVSIHRYDHGDFYPFEVSANFDAVGKGQGAGYNINIPWNKSGVGDGEYLSAIFHIILPVGYQFNPELVIVSAGFDAGRNDPLGSCCVSPECYGHMTHLLSCLANGRIILALEGGYNLTTISEAVCSCTDALLGNPLTPIPSTIKVSPSAIGSILNTIRVHKKYWSCLQFDVDLPSYELEKTALKNLESTELSELSTDAQALNDLFHSASGERAITFEQIKDGDSVNPQMTLPNTLYCVVPLDWCPHLERIQPMPPEDLDPKTPCETCGDPRENWVCLHCYQVHCGRYINEHMIQHGIQHHHQLTLSYSDLSVWCYECESYVHNEVLLPFKRDAHWKKFGEIMLGTG